MSIDEKEFIRFSKSESVTDEFTYRNKISRGYYGAYHMCQKFFDEDPEVPSTSSHSVFISFLEESNSLQKRLIGRKLFYLKKHREKADYHLNSDVNENTLKMVLSEIDNLLVKLN